MYEFGEYRLDPRRRVLSRANGERIALKPKVFDTLLYLVEHAGELVDRDALIEAVWPKVIVEEHNLNKNVSALRRLFDETPEQHRFIVTEPGRGYRFVATVRRMPEPPDEPARPESERPPTEAVAMAPAGTSQPVAAGRSGGWRLPAYAKPAAGVAGLALVAALIAVNLRAPAPSTAPEMRVEITTPWTPALAEFAVSPDGRKLVFIGDHEGQYKLWVRSLDRSAAEPLAGTEGARNPFWSPDSRSVGFFTLTALKRIDIDGGRPLTLAPALNPAGGAWGVSGTILYAPDVRAPLRSIADTGGTPVSVTMLDGSQYSHSFPHFLPGGREFLFYSAATNPDANGLYIGSLDTSITTRILGVESRGAYVSPGWLMFARDGALLAQRFDVGARRLLGEPVIVADSVATEALNAAAFSTSTEGLVAYRGPSNGLRQLWWFNRAGVPLGSIGPTERTLANLVVSPNGHHVAVERYVQGDADVWLLDAERSTRLTRDASAELYPVWSPDGSRIAFQTIEADGSITLSEKLANGADAARVLLEGTQPMLPCDWSPDGRFLLYIMPAAETGPDLWVLPVDGQHQPFVFHRTAFREGWGQFSPDGQWVAYHSNESGTFEVYVRSFPASDLQFAVSTAGGVYPRWSADGRELYYIDPRGTLTAAAVESTGRGLRVGAPTALFHSKRVGGGANVLGRSQQYDAGPDGTFLINVETESTAPPITLLLNWSARAE